MSQAPAQLRNHLAGDEQLAAVYTATISEQSRWLPVTLGVTDRRVLCVTEDGRTVSLRLDGIGSIRSRPLTSVSYRGNDHRLMMGVGGLVAVLCFGAVVALASSMFVLLLLPILIGGLASAEYQRRKMGEIDVDALVNGIRHAAAAEGDRGGTEHPYAEPDDDPQVMLLGNGLIAVVSLVAIVALSSSGLVVLFSLTAIGGLALVEYARRHAEDFGGFEIVREHRCEVSIGVEDGTTVHLRCDPSAGVDRDIGRVAFTEPDESIRTLPSRS